MRFCEVRNMIRFILLLAACVSAAVSVSGQLPRYVMRSRPFDELHVSGRVQVDCRVVPDSAGYVAFSASASGAEALKMANAGRVLSITFASGCQPKEVRDVVVYLAEPLTTVQARGAARVSVPAMGVPEADAFVVLNGSGSVTVDGLRASQAVVSLNGGGRVNLDGKVEAKLLNLNCSGSGTLNAADIDCGSVNANLQGSGRIVMSGTARQATASAYGSGVVNASELSTPVLKASALTSGRVVYGRGCRDVKMSGNLGNIQPAPLR